jgi:hypothetical protein
LCITTECKFCKCEWVEAWKLSVQTPEILLKSTNNPFTNPETGIQFSLPFSRLKDADTEEWAKGKGNRKFANLIKIHVPCF